MSDAPIEIEQYDPAWPEQFSREREVVQNALSHWLVGSPEHIGSTAVPGLVAKPGSGPSPPLGSNGSRLSPAKVADSETTNARTNIVLFDAGHCGLDEQAPQ